MGMGNNNEEEVAERIFVSVRLRPMNDKEMARNEPVDWECINDSTIVYKNRSAPEQSLYPTSYTFDRVFRCDSSTKQVYEQGAKAVVLSVVGGINASVFAYGQTSSGKTYTMTGITEYTMADIFQYIQEHKEREFLLKFSAMEIYNESVRDLLSPDAGALRLLDDPERGTVIEKLTEETVCDWHHLRDLLYVCEAQRQIGETSLNESSSRSHQIIRLTVESSARDYLGTDNSSSLVATVNFVDLAGSERASQTISGGSRLKEGCHINRSLLTLGSVIRKLSKGRNGHIPYRDSKLTRILQSSLGGNARTAIICTMSPARVYVEQSRNTLLFASCANEVSTNAHVNVVMSDKALVKHLQRELSRLESELRSALPSARADAGLLLREKDLEIAKLEKEVRELTQQRNLALAQVQDLQQGLADGQNALAWHGPDPYYPNLHIRQSWESPSSGASTSVDDHPVLAGSGRFETHDSSERHSESVSNENNLVGYIEENILPCNASHNMPTESFSGVSFGVLNETPNSLVSGPYKVSEVIEGQFAEPVEDFCKEVRCIELEGPVVCQEVETSSLCPDANEKTLLAVLDENAEKADEDNRFQSLKQNAEGANPCPVYPLLSTKGQSAVLQIDDVFACKNVDPIEIKSCQESIDVSMPPSWPTKIEKEAGEFVNLYSNDEECIGKLQDIQQKASVLRSNDDNEILSQKCCEITYGNFAVDGLQKVETKTSCDDDGADCGISIAVMDLTRIALEKELDDTQVDDRLHKDTKPIKNVTSVGLDTLDDLGNTHWVLDFNKLQREIINLWHFCYVPLIYRTYFLLVFKDAIADTIYMEVERRRLSFIKEAFSWGHEAVLDGEVITLGSSVRSLRHEREMLAGLMKKQLSKQERKVLYSKWGIRLDTKNRSLQLANLLWSDNQDMNLLIDSAGVVARLTKLNFQEVRKEMFGINLIPRQHRRKLYSWKLSSRLLL